MWVNDCFLKTLYWKRYNRQHKLNERNLGLLIFSIFYVIRFNKYSNVNMTFATLISPLTADSHRQTALILPSCEALLNGSVTQILNNHLMFTVLNLRSPLMPASSGYKITMVLPYPLED